MLPRLVVSDLHVMEKTDLTTEHSDLWQLGQRGSIVLDTPLVMGILNATPDSFHDGRSDFDDTTRLVESGLAMVRQGAQIIDVGGESTRPGADRIDPAEQCRRTTELIRQLSARSSCLISIDTTHASVAEAALEAGGAIVNDVSAGTEDPALLALVAERGCGLILMHRRVPPVQDVYSDEYSTDPDFGAHGVVSSVGATLTGHLAAAREVGVAAQQILLDPGLGFGKSVRQNLELIRGIPELQTALGRPLLIGASRKSFIGSILGDRPPSDRLFGSLAVAVLAAESGAAVIRTHDVGPTIDSLQVAEAIRRLSPASGGTIT